MLRAVCRQIFAALASDDEDESDEGETRFVPSPLDMSVRYAHGGSTHEVQRELADIEKQARTFDEQPKEE